MHFLLVLSLVVFAITFLVLVIKIIGYLYPYFFWGAIYVPTSNEKVEKMINLLEIKPGQLAADLGAGDGRLLIALAKAGAKAYGCEINPFLVLLAKKNIKEAGLEGKAFVFWKSLWNQDLAEFDAVVVYGMRHMMGKLEKKFENELKPGAKIASNYFVLPRWRPIKVTDKVYFYTIKS